MTKVTKEEILKIARMSHIELREDEVEPLIAQMEGVLTYAERVKEIAGNADDIAMHGQVNVMREDEVCPSPADKVMAVAPEKEADLFVVPAILETNK